MLGRAKKKFPDRGGIAETRPFVGFTSLRAARCFAFSLLANPRSRGVPESGANNKVSGGIYKKERKKQKKARIPPPHSGAGFGPSSIEGNTGVGLPPSAERKSEGCSAENLILLLNHHLLKNTPQHNFNRPFSPHMLQPSHLSLIIIKQTPTFLKLNYPINYTQPKPHTKIPTATPTQHIHPKPQHTQPDTPNPSSGRGAV